MNILFQKLKKLTKSSFDVESIIDAAGELKYLSQIKRILHEQFKEPEEDFVKFFASRTYVGTITAKVKALFTEITGKALVQFLNDAVNDRLKNAIGSGARSEVKQDTIIVHEEINDKDPKIITTDEEIEGFNIVRAILRREFEIFRIIARDTQSYFGILLDDNNRKPLCRLHFNSKQKYLGLFDADKKETRYALDSIDSIYNFTEQLIESTAIYKNDSLAIKESTEV